MNAVSIEINVDVPAALGNEGEHIVLLLYYSRLPRKGSCCWKFILQGFCELRLCRVVFVVQYTVAAFVFTKHNQSAGKLKIAFVRRSGQCHRVLQKVSSHIVVVRFRRSPARILRPFLQHRHTYPSVTRGSITKGSVHGYAIVDKDIHLDKLCVTRIEGVVHLPPLVHLVLLRLPPHVAACCTNTLPSTTILRSHLEHLRTNL